MSDGVIFDDEIPGDTSVGNIRIVPGAPTGLLAWLIKNKLAKDGRSAEQILLGFAITAVVLAIGIFIASVTNVFHPSLVLDQAQIWAIAHMHPVSNNSSNP